MGFTRYTPYNVAYLYSGAQALYSGYKQLSKGRSATIVVRPRKKDTMAYGTFSQHRKKYSSGRKLPYAKYVDKITTQAIDHQVERYSKVSDAAGTLGTNRGSTWLSYGDDAAVYAVYDTNASVSTNVTVTQYPIHLFNLTTTRCNANVLGITQGRCGWKCAVVNTAGALQNKVVWLPLFAYDRNTTVAPNSYPIAANQQWEVEDVGNAAGAGGTEFGRSALLEWTEARMLFYGKKTRPTKIVVSFVSFPETGYAPDWQYYDNGFGANRVVDNDASEFWKTRIQPLVNNPCTVTKVLTEGNHMRVISSFKIDIAPKESIDSDSDPHQEFRRWFNRWNRKLDYSYENTVQLSNLELQDPQVYPNVAGDAPVPGYSKFTNNLKGAVYIMITSYQPEAEAIAADETGPTNAVTASYDFNIRKSSGIVSS